MSRNLWACPRTIPTGQSGASHGDASAHDRWTGHLNLVQARVKRILDFAELAVPADKFERFRTLVFNEFGHEGFRKDLGVLLNHGGQSGMEGNGTGRNDSGRKGGAP